MDYNELNEFFAHALQFDRSVIANVTRFLFGRQSKIGT